MPSNKLNNTLASQLAVLKPYEALASVLSPDKKEIYASGDKLYRNAFFGRDSLTVAQDLIEFDKELSAKLLIRNAQLQGFRFDRKSEEEPGKIAHEHRTRVNDKASMLIFDELVDRWGSYNGEMTYFGSIDSTPLFIRVLCKYVDHYDSQILDQQIRRRNGDTVTLSQSLTDAVDWLIDKLKASSSGLLEYKRTNPKGLLNQAWKDSVEFYVHEDGTSANHSKPLASVEVQGLAYDALVLGARVLPRSQNYMKTEAIKLRDRMLELLWLPDRKYFALGVDRDKKGFLRHIKTKTANPAALLQTGIFDELAEPDQQKYISAITTTVMSRDLLTDAGVRSRALSAAHLTPFWAYHGAHTTWPKETSEIAHGLKRWGFRLLANQLENRMLNAVTRVASYPELIYVDDNGAMLTDVQHTREHEGLKIIEATNKPEAMQAWTITAVIWALHDLYDQASVKPKPQAAWQHKLEWEVLDKLPIIGHIRREEDLFQLYPELKGALITPHAQHAQFFPQKVAGALRA